MQRAFNKKMFDNLSKSSLQKYALMAHVHLLSIWGHERLTALDSKKDAEKDAA